MDRENAGLRRSGSSAHCRQGSNSLARCRRKASVMRSRSIQNGLAISLTSPGSTNRSTQSIGSRGMSKFPSGCSRRNTTRGWPGTSVTFKIPTEWRDKRVVLTLERPHWETCVWVDGRELGSNNSLSTPHEYDLGTALAPGIHQLTIRVDNSLVRGYRRELPLHYDHTQGNWNGIVGEISLRATRPGVD